MAKSTAGCLAPGGRLRVLLAQSSPALLVNVIEHVILKKAAGAATVGILCVVLGLSRALIRLAPSQSSADTPAAS